MFYGYVSHAIASAQLRRAVCQRELSVLFRLLSVIKVLRWSFCVTHVVKLKHVTNNEITLMHVSKLNANTLNINCYDELPVM